MRLFKIINRRLCLKCECSRKIREFVDVRNDRKLFTSLNEGLKHFGEIFQESKFAPKMQIAQHTLDDFVYIYGFFFYESRSILASQGDYTFFLTY